jgi:hypothetical protein
MTINPISSGTSYSATSDVNAASQKQRAAFQSLAGALQAGDLAAAQTAFGQWQQDQQSLSSLLTANGKQRPTDTQTATDIQNIGAALQSGNVTEAQKALAQLKIDMQSARGAHHAKHVRHAEAAGEIENDGDSDDAASASGGVSFSSGTGTAALTPDQVLQAFLKQLQTGTYTQTGTAASANSSVGLSKLA